MCARKGLQVCISELTWPSGSRCSSLWCTDRSVCRPGRSLWRLCEHPAGIWGHRLSLGTGTHRDRRMEKQCYSVLTIKDDNAAPDAGRHSVLLKARTHCSIHKSQAAGSQANARELQSNLIHTVKTCWLRKGSSKTKRSQRRQPIFSIHSCQFSGGSFQAFCQRCFLSKAALCFWLFFFYLSSNQVCPFSYCAASLQSSEQNLNQFCLWSDKPESHFLQASTDQLWKGVSLHWYMRPSLMEANELNM